MLHSEVVYSGVGWCKTARSCEKQCVVSDEAAKYNIYMSRYIGQVLVQLQVHVEEY